VAQRCRPWVQTPGPQKKKKTKTTAIKIVSVTLPSWNHTLSFQSSHLCMHPWSSVKRWLPALVCKASTFWVTNQYSFPSFSQLLKAQCAGFGWCEENWGQPTKFLAQYRWRIGALRTKSTCWMGLRSVRA
jgi:hypothetical protein